MTVNLGGLHPTLMRPRVEATLDDPRALALHLYVVSAFRSIERQRQLFDAAVKKYGTAREARKWVAPPGKSNHGPKVEGFGTAVDFGIPGVHADNAGHWPPEIRQAVDAIAADHGLASVLPWEDWHYEPIAGWKPPALDPPAVVEVLMPLFKNDDDALAFGVVYAYSMLLGRPIESVEALAMRMQQIKDNGYAHVWDDIAKAPESKEYIQSLVT